MAELDTYDLKNLNINKKEVLKKLDEEIRSSFLDLNSNETKEKRHKRFNIAGAKPDDYEEHYLEIGQKQQVICGIRHMNLDVNSPFINLRCNFLLESNHQLLEIYEIIKDRFKVFMPKFLCFHSSNLRDVDRIGSIYMAATVEDVVSKKPWLYQKDLEFINVENDDYYDWYKTEYEKFHQEREDLAQAVTMNSKAIMDSSKRDGLLYKVYLANKQIGLIAGERAEFMLKRGLYFNDIVIKSEHKGKGLAKAMQKKFIEMHENNFDLVFGTIDFSNKPSLNTAKANKRVPIRYENFIKI